MRITPQAALAGVMVLAVAMRFVSLGRNSLWDDEAFVVWVVRHGWREILPILRQGDVHPPLYYVLIKAWTSLAGTGEAALRFPSACFAAVSVALTYVLMRRIAAEGTALLSAFLVAVSPFQVMAAQDARMYALLGALALASTLVLHEGAVRGGPKPWAAYSILAALMLYTHDFAFLALAAHGAWALLYARRRFGLWLAAAAVAIIFYAPWLPSLWAQILQAAGSSLLPSSSPNVIVGDTIGMLSFGGSLFGMGDFFRRGTLGPAGQFVVLLPFLAVLWRGLAGRERPDIALIAMPLGLTLAVLVAFRLAVPIFFARWVSFLGPFYLMLLARGIVDIGARAPERWRAWTTIVVTGALLAYGMPALADYYLDTTSRRDWRGVSTVVAQGMGPHDVGLFVGRATAQLPFSYYLPGLPSVTTDLRRPIAEPQLRWLAARYPRMWLIVARPYSPYGPYMRAFFPALGKAYQVVGAHDFKGQIWVYLLRAVK
ncbi:MAG TPA: glycosyltransferase family 39 protein [bacterium]|nr:glycosyltransferase family 39 protein [bacterium]